MLDIKTKYREIILWQLKCHLPDKEKWNVLMFSSYTNSKKILKTIFCKSYTIEGTRVSLSLKKYIAKVIYDTAKHWASLRISQKGIVD